jgi:anthranilate synthase component 1
MKKIDLPAKPTYIKLAENIDIMKLFAAIEQEYASCFLFESLSEKSAESRFSVIGFAPEHVVRLNNNQLFLDNVVQSVSNPYEALRDLIPQDSLTREYAGGLVGYLGFDGISLFEPTLSVLPHPHFDTFCFGVYTDGIVLDNVTGEVFYFFFTTNRVDQVRKLLRKRVHTKRVHIKKTKNSLSKKKHAHAVKQVLEEIKAGNTFQCEVGIQEEFEITGSPFALYKKLRTLNPSPFMYYVKFGKKVIIGASPELLFSMRDSEMVTRPLAGTIKRGKTLAEDQLLARELLHDQKELAEHNMLIDLHRNDMGKVAKVGSVKIRDFMDIKRFSHVQHIASEIVGLKNRGEDMFSCLASNFPAGTLSGAPKIESVRIISRVEEMPRGPYGGAVGHFGFNGNCTFAIAIRTIFIDENYGFTQAASGIVADSVAEKEYDEVQRKLGAMKEALGI